MEAHVDGMDVETGRTIAPVVVSKSIFTKECCYRCVYFSFISLVAFAGMIVAAMLIYLFDHLKV